MAGEGLSHYYFPTAVSQPARQTDTVNSEINKKLLQNDLIVIIITMSEKKQKQQQFVCFYSAAAGRT